MTTTGKRIARLPLRVPERGRQLANLASAVMGNNLVTAALGIVFWMLAARGLVPSEVGQLGAITSAMLLLGSLGAMGLGPLMISELPLLKPSHQRALFSVSIMAAGVVGMALGLVFGVVAGPLGRTWEPISAFTPAWLWLGVGSALTALFQVFDQAMLVVGNPQLQVWRNMVASLVKIALLALAFVLARVSLTVALAAWALGLLSGAVMAIRSGFRHMPSAQRLTFATVAHIAREFGRASLAHQGVNYALYVSGIAMPPIIAMVVTTEENGIYTTVRLASMVVFMLPYAVALSVFAQLSGAAEHDPVYLRRVFWLAMGISLAVCALIAAAAPWVLWPFGGSWSEQGSAYLRMIVIAGPLLVIKDQYIMRTRLERQMTKLLWYVVFSALLEVGFTVVGGVRWGLGGALMGWNIALAIIAVVAIPRLFGPSQTTTGPAGDGGDAAELDRGSEPDRSRGDESGESGPQVERFTIYNRILPGPGRRLEQRRIINAHHRGTT
ncbi:MAG: hypothetical protein IPI32_14810 [Austwickia sp.]|nr:hypothetical protein [Austwickia sp.]MBK9100959.1 hypothetical protein [Austwickia sp.]